MRTPIYFIVLEQFMKNQVSTFVWLYLSLKDDQDRGEDTKIYKIFLGGKSRLHHKISKFVQLDYLLKMIRIVVETLKFQKKILEKKTFTKTTNHNTIHFII